MAARSDVSLAADLPPNPEVLKEDLRSRVEKFGSGEDAVVRKCYENSPLSMLCWFRRLSRAGREFRNLSELGAAGIPVVRPVSWGETRTLEFVRRSFLVTEWQEASNLEAILARCSDAATRQDLTRKYGELMRRVHLAGFLSFTPNPRNVLVRNGVVGEELCFCDQPLTLRFRRSVHGGRLAEIDLYRVAFTVMRQLEHSRAERYRVILAYAGGERRTARRIWRRLRRRGRVANRTLRAFVYLWSNFLLAPFHRRANPAAVLKASGLNASGINASG